VITGNPVFGVRGSFCSVAVPIAGDIGRSERVGNVRTTTHPSWFLTCEGAGGRTATKPPSLYRCVTPPTCGVTTTRTLFRQAAGELVVCPIRRYGFRSSPILDRTGKTSVRPRVLFVEMAESYNRLLLSTGLPQIMLHLHCFPATQ